MRRTWHHDNKRQRAATSILPTVPQVPRRSTAPTWVSRIGLTVDIDETERLIRSWAQGFRVNELTADDIHERFATLEPSEVCTTPEAAKLIADCKRELDAIRWSMCEAGQRGEIERIFVEFEQLFARGRVAE